VHLAVRPIGIKRALFDSVPTVLYVVDRADACVCVLTRACVSVDCGMPTACYIYSVCLVLLGIIRALFDIACRWC
jgi:hypothetical protein